jgi:hypothetical protein
VKKLIWTLLVVALVSIVFFANRVTTAKRESLPILVAENVLMTESGRYSAPNGSQLVEIRQENDGSLKFFVSRTMGDGTTGGGPAASFQAKSEWFMCWDSNDKLWTYIPEQDHQYCRNWYANDKGSGCCLVGEFGGWQGIPDSFFERLPESVKATYSIYVAEMGKAAGSGQVQ